MTQQILMFMYSKLDHVPPVMNEARSLVEAGFTVRVLGIRHSRKRPAHEEVDGVHLHRMYLVSRLLVRDDDRFEIVRYGEAVLRSFFWGLFHRAVLLVAHDLIALPFVYPLARLRRKPVVYRAHELWSEQSAVFPRRGFWNRLDRWFVSRVDLLVVPEQHRGRIYQDELGAPRAPLLIYNCMRLIAEPADSPLGTRLREHGIAHEFVVYYQGGIKAGRLVDNLVKSMVYTPDSVSLALVGPMEPDFKLWYDRYVVEHGLLSRVVHLGTVPYGEELFALCSGANVGVMFVSGDCRNNRYNVTAANKVFEYMMLGVAILTNDYDSHKMFVESQGIGRCTNAADPRAIGDAITRLASDRIGTHAMGRTGRRLSEERYRWEKEAEKLVSAYASLIRGHT